MMVMIVSYRECVSCGNGCRLAGHCEPQGPGGSATRLLSRYGGAVPRVTRLGVASAAGRVSSLWR
jgi:hypothetical protein